jgi:hypothetical protein
MMMMMDDDDGSWLDVKGVLCVTVATCIGWGWLEA